MEYYIIFETIQLFAENNGKLWLLITTQLRPRRTNNSISQVITYGYLYSGSNIQIYMRSLICNGLTPDLPSHVIMSENQGAPKAREVNLVRARYFQVTLLASGRERSRFVHIIWTIDSTSLLVVP